MAEEHEMTSEDLFTQEMKLAALKAYAEVNGTCRPVAMTAALNAALAVMPKQPVDMLEEALREIIIKDDTGPMAYQLMKDGSFKCVGGTEGKFATIARAALANEGE